MPGGFPSNKASRIIFSLNLINSVKRNFHCKDKTCKIYKCKRFLPTVLAKEYLVVWTNYIKLFCKKKFRFNYWHYWHSKIWILGSRGVIIFFSRNFSTTLILIKSDKKLFLEPWSGLSRCNLLYDSSLLVFQSYISRPFRALSKLQVIHKNYVLSWF